MGYTSKSDMGTVITIQQHPSVEVPTQNTNMMRTFKLHPKGPKESDFTEVCIKQGNKGRAKHALVVCCMTIPARWAKIVLQEHSTSNHYDKGIETQGQRMDVSFVPPCTFILAVIE